MKETLNSPIEPAVGPPLEHEALLTLARKVEGAARDGDRQHLQMATAHLREALVHHLDAERRILVELSSEDSRRVLQGQRNLLALLGDLTAAARRPDLAPCDGIAQRLVAQLSLQADDERVNVARFLASGGT